MLAPRASSAFVCIRCELRLARPRLAAVPRLPRANFSTSARRHDGSDEFPPFQFPEPKPRSELSEKPLGRLRRRKGKAPIRETTARLGGGVKALGDDAQILVLKEEGDAPPEEMPAPHIDTREPVDLYASIDQEKAAPDQNDINARLESLRPRTHAPPEEPQYISQAEYIRLHKNLVDGYSGVQLQRYFASQKDFWQRKLGQSETKDTSIAKQPIDRTDWHPGTTKLTRRLPGTHVVSAAGYNKRQKNILADQIVRTAWNVVLLEEIEAPGEIEITLKAWQLHLLNTITPSPLDRIGRERKAKIEVHAHTNVVRITADKSTAEYAADDIKQLLQDTETLRLNLEPWVPYLSKGAGNEEFTTASISAQLLHAVGNMSGAYIQAATKHILLIRGIVKASTEEAKRALLRLLPFQPFPRVVDSWTLTEAQKTGILLPTPFKNFLDQRHKNADLGRWSLPVSRPTEEGSKIRKIDGIYRSEFTEKVAKTVIKALQENREAVKVHKSVPTIEEQALRNLEAVKSFKLATTVSVEFGQVLIPMENNGGSDTSASSFCHVFPGLSQFLLNDALPTEARYSSPKLEYEFTANPVQQNAMKGYRYPDLVIQIRYQPGGKPQFVKLTLRTNEYSHDVPLPEKAVDVRYKITQDLVMWKTVKPQPKVEAFVNAVCANIESGDRLTAPPSLEIVIPKSAIPGFGPQAKGTRNAEYIFTGIRHRQSVNSKYKDHDISYSTTRAGKLGMKGGRLAMYYSVTKDPVLNKEKALTRFMETSFAMADVLTEAATNNKPMAKVLRPRDQMSARKQRRLALGSSGENAACFGEGTRDADGYVPLKDTAVEKDEDGATPGFSFLNETNGDNQDQNDDHRRTFLIEDGDIEDPFIASFLSQEEYIEPEIVEEATAEAVTNEDPIPEFMAAIEDPVAAVAIDEVVNVPASSEAEGVSPTEEKKALHSSA